MGAGPQFGAAVCGRGIDDGHVDDHAIGRRRHLEIRPELTRVNVEGLLSGVGQAGVAAVEGVFDALAEYCVSYFDDEVVGQHVAKEVGREGRWVLLQVAVVKLVGDVGEVEDLFDVAEHALAQHFDMRGINGAMEDDEASVVQGGDGLLQVLRF